MQAQIAELETKALDASIWNDPASAQGMMRQLAELKDQVELWNGLAQRVRDGLELLELAEAEDDSDTALAVAADADALLAEVDRLEFQLALSGPHDRGGAILSIHAGAGGTEAQDWAEMLLRMYLR
ncbi:MAG TPA: PCRF domain-containing protein, partial [Anaerolineae bacterium]|nr:PCRF domain-containing protein [Anaerolineae bacterium]